MIVELEHYNLIVYIASFISYWFDETIFAEITGEVFRTMEVPETGHKT